MKRRLQWNNLVPIAVIIVLVIFLTFLSDGKLIKPATLTSLLQQMIAYLIVGLGMVFVMALGQIDMSVGVNVCLSTALAFSLVGQYGWLPMIIVSCVIGAVFGLISGALVAIFNVQSFMVTIALQIGLRGVIKAAFLSYPSGRIVFDSNILSFDTAVNGFAIYKLIILGIVLIAVILLFEFSPLGYKLKATGENEKCAFLSGINIKKVKASAFVICGALAGLAGPFFATRTGGVNSDTGTGLEMSVMLGMFLAGIPVEGGMQTNIYKVIIGLPAIIIIQSGLNIAHVSAGIYQLIEGVILLVIIILTKYMKTWANARDDKQMAKILLEEEKKAAPTEQETK